MVLTLAVGIGSNTAIFSALNAVLFRPLPYPAPDRLVMVWGRFTGIGLPNDQNLVSAPELLDLRRYSKAFESLTAMSSTSFNLSVDGKPERVDGALVTPEFFQTLGVAPLVGGAFRSEHGVAGGDTVVVLGYDLWQRRFGGQSAVIGRAVSINARSYTVVGIAPPRFRFPGDAEMWAPLAFTNAQLSPDFRGNHGLVLFARVAPGLSIEQARGDMQTVTRQMIEGAPDYPYERYNFQVLLTPFLEQFVGDVRPALLLLMGAVAVVLLIACVNVANLLLAKASSRELEIAVRLALGATRARLIRQLLTESVILALGGAVAGALLAALGLESIRRLGSTVFPRVGEARLDAATLVFTTTVAVATGLLFGVAPAVQSTRASGRLSLEEGGRRATAGVEHQRLRKMLIVSEVALALVLLTGAGLLVKSFARLLAVDPGFKPDHVLTFRVSLPQARYGTPAQMVVFYRELTRRVRELPAVQAAGAISGLPLTGQGFSGTTTMDSRAVPSDRSAPEADMRAVTPGYLEAMGVQLLRGRYFDDRDTETSAPVAIVDETLANTYWPNEDPLAKRIKRGGPSSTNPWMTIVGVVKHVRYASLERPSRVQYVWPYVQNPVPNMSIALRTGTDPHSVATLVERLVPSLDPDLPAYAVRTMNDVVSTSLMRRRLVVLLLGVFAGMALLLAAVGIYGVVSYWVAERSREIGIRSALGATESSIVRLAFKQSLTMAVAGISLGVAGSLALSRILAGMLFDVRAADPGTFAWVAAALVGVVLLASYLPARRAARLDPARALRQT